MKQGESNDSSTQEITSEKINITQNHSVQKSQKSSMNANV